MASEKEISLGEYLRQERERRGITIEQVASATKVGVRTLHALEGDHYSELPAKPFIRGFVTSYCRFIGLDPKETLSLYDDYIQLKASERPNRESGHSGYAFEKRDGEQQSRTILLIAICTFMVLGGVAMLILKPSLKHHRPSHLDKLRAAHQNPNPTPLPSATSTHAPLPSPTSTSVSAPVTSTHTSTPVSTTSSTIPAPISSSSPTPHSFQQVIPPETNPATQKPGGNPADPLDSGHELKSEEIHHKIVLKVKKDIWVRYQVDTRPVRKFIIRQGKVLILRAKDEIRLQVSHPEEVAVTVNGHSQKFSLTSPGTAMKQGMITLFLPTENAQKIDRPFGDSTQLPTLVPEAKVDHSSQDAPKAE